MRRTGFRTKRTADLGGRASRDSPFDAPGARSWGGSETSMRIASAILASALLAPRFAASAERPPAFAQSGGLAQTRGMMKREINGSRVDRAEAEARVDALLALVASCGDLQTELSPFARIDAATSTLPSDRRALEMITSRRTIWLSGARSGAWRERLRS